MDVPDPSQTELPSEGPSAPGAPAATGLEQRVLARALQLIDVAPEDPDVLGRMEASMREVLYRQELNAAEERHVLSSSEGEASAGMERVLAARIERAVAACLEAAGPLRDFDDDSIRATAVELLKGMDASDFEGIRARLAPSDSSTETDWIRESLRAGGEEDPLVGTLFHSKYRILRCVGRGGFGAVYEALDERGAQNSVAIKVMLPEAARTRMFLEAFRAEAVRVTRLNHPNIVDWKTFDRTDDGQFYFVMELLEGEDLSRILRDEGALETKRAVQLLLQILKALRAAHFVGDSESILHLDLKPRNIIILPEQRNRAEQVKVIDFGIGQFVGGEDAALEPLDLGRTGGSRPTPPDELAALKGQGTLSFTSNREEAIERLGHGLSFRLSHACTPEFASPEQCVHILYANGLGGDPQPLDGRADLYSLGVLAYRMLTGRLPFPPTTERKEYLDLHLTEPILPWDKEGQRLPKRLREFVERCLQKDRDARFRDAEEACEVLERIARPATKSLATWIGVPSIALSAGLFGYLTWGVSREVTTVDFVTPDGESIEAGADLFAGPERASLALTVDRSKLVDSSKLEELADEEWQVIDQDSREPLEEWTCVVTESGVELHASNFLTKNQSGRDEWQVRLESDNKAWTSQPFDLIWVGGLAWSASFGLAYLEDEREVDALLVDAIPTLDVADKAALVLRVRGPAAAELKEPRVQLKLEAPELQEPLVLRVIKVPPSEEGDDVVYRFPLDTASDLEGKVSWSATATGPADRKWEDGGHVTLRNEKLEVSQLELRDSKTSLPWMADGTGVYFIGGEATPELVLESNHPSRVSWRLGTPEALETLKWSPETECTGETKLLLPSLANWSGKGEQTLSVRFTEPGVLGSGDRHSLEESLRLFVSQPKAPSVTLHRGGATRNLESSTLVYVQPGEWSIRVTPGCSNTKTVSIELIGPDGEAVHEDEVPNITGVAKSFDLSILQEGEYRLRLRAYLQRRLGQPRLSEDFDDRSWTIVVDSQPPKLTLTPSFTESLITSQMESVSVSVESQRAGGSPLIWSWSLPEMDLGPHDGGKGGRIEFHPLSKDFEGHDGFLELKIECEDLAGNVGNTEVYEFERACEGPTIELVDPQKEARLTTGAVLPWPFDNDGTLQVKAVLEDPNGLSEVSCWVYRESELDTKLKATTLAPNALASQPTGCRLSWTLLPPETWSGAQDVHLRFEALDKYGNPTLRDSIGPFELDSFQRELPSRISATATNGERTHNMRLVPMDPERAFWLGGRSADVEDEAYAKAGLKQVRWDADHGTTTRTPWGVEVGGDLASDYYLDEREVSVGQFLEFLASPHGWGNDALWTLGRSLPTGRQDSLRARLEAEDPEWPVTGVSAQEAAAYAAWAGKRLPTLLELQHATRGGMSYRPFASYDGEPWSEALEFEIAKGPRSVFVDSKDITPDTRIQDLGSNVAEWTHSPAYNGRSTVAADFALDARPGGRKSRLWVAGGHFDSRVFHACLASALSPNSTRSFIGFRCAASASDVRKRLASPESLGARFEKATP